MRERELLVLDGLGNLALGLLLLLWPIRLANWLGIADTGSRFYPSLFGAVLFGIGVALLMESTRGSVKAKGLGLGGALAINTCFGLVLAAWLLFGGLTLPTHGSAILWGLVVVLLGLSGIELATERRVVLSR
jgi:hypothetical protein